MIPNIQTPIRPPVRKPIARSGNLALYRAGTPRSFNLRVTRWGQSKLFAILFEDGRVRKSRDALALRTIEPDALAWAEGTLQRLHANNSSEGFTHVAAA